jgi:uncharacterized protein (TIGR03089 family)
LAKARADLLTAHPTAPLITDCTQGRVELSQVTFDNWVCKTVNFLRLELDVEPGSVIGVDLPLHWMSAVWFVAVWESGAHVSLQAGADLRVGTTDDADVLVVPDPFGMAPPPAGSKSEAYFPADVRAMPDALILPSPQPGAMAGGADAPELAAAAAHYAERVGLRARGRLLTDLAPRDLPGVLAAIAAPLSVGAAVVYGGDPHQEATTAVAM